MNVPQPTIVAMSEMGLPAPKMAAATGSRTKPSRSRTNSPNTTPTAAIAALDRPIAQAIRPKTAPKPRPTARCIPMPNAAWFVALGVFANAFARIFPVRP